MSIAQHSLLASPAGAIGWMSRIKAAASGLAQEWRARRGLRELQELDVRALRDIGMAPGGLEGAVLYGRRSRIAPSDGRPPVAPLMPASFTEWR